MKKRAVVPVNGGSQDQTYKKGEKKGCYILFHCGEKKEFSPMVKKEDYVVVLLGAIGHVTMDLVKKLSKEEGKTIWFHKGFGATGATTAPLESQAC